MSQGITSGGTPIELYNKRQSKLSEIEDKLDSLNVVVDHELEVTEYADIVGTVDLQHDGSCHQMNRLMDAEDLTAFGVMSHSSSDGSVTFTLFIKQC